MKLSWAVTFTAKASQYLAATALKHHQPIVPLITHYHLIAMYNHGFRLTQLFHSITSLTAPILTQELAGGQVKSLNAIIARVGNKELCLMMIGKELARAIHLTGLCPCLADGSQQF